jgi:hypothetical protein
MSTGAARPTPRIPRRTPRRIPSDLWIEAAATGDAAPPGGASAAPRAGRAAPADLGRPGRPHIVVGLTAPGGQHAIKFTCINNAYPPSAPGKDPGIAVPDRGGCRGLPTAVGRSARCRGGVPSGPGDRDAGPHEGLLVPAGRLNFQIWTRFRSHLPPTARRCRPRRAGTGDMPDPIDIEYPCPLGPALQVTVHGSKVTSV